MKTVEGFGIVHCAGCEKNLAFFPPDTTVSDVELYCCSCAKQLKVEEIDV